MSVLYDKSGDGMIRVSDNAMGMNLADLEHALEVGGQPANTSGRAQFGMGMKTAACWFGDVWSVRTKRLGDTDEIIVTVDVDAVADGAQELPTKIDAGKSPDTHYTVIEITKLNRRLYGRTLGKIKQWLAFIYRVDLREDRLRLFWQDEQLTWQDDEDRFVVARDGTPYRKDLDFEVDGKRVFGWVGVLAQGSRSKAGFSILRRGRVIKGCPDSWRPESLFGQIQGSNDLVNQRLVGELNMDDFDVSQTKDDILWSGSEEDDVQDTLKDLCADYREVARSFRKRREDERGPSDVEVSTALDEFKSELSSAELADVITLETVPPPEVLAETFRPLLDVVDSSLPAFSAKFEERLVLGYLANDPSPNDPYVVVDSTSDTRLLVIVNMRHPHIREISGSEGMLNYLRECTYDALAEWRARHSQSQLNPDTIKMFKDRFLRLAMEIETHAGRAPEAPEEMIS